MLDETLLAKLDDKELVALLAELRSEMRTDLKTGLGFTIETAERGVVLMALIAHRVSIDPALEKRFNRMIDISASSSMRGPQHHMRRIVGFLMREAMTPALRALMEQVQNQCVSAMEIIKRDFHGPWTKDGVRDF